MLAPLLLTLGAFAAGGGSTKNLDGQYGFRDVLFEQQCVEIQDLVTHKDATDARFSAIRRTDSLNIGKARLQSILYSCYLGQLTSVTLLGHGQVNAARLLDTLTEAYGAPDQPDSDVQEFLWEGKKVTLEMRVDPTDHIVVIFANAAMYEFQLQTEDEERRSAVNDL